MLATAPSLRVCVGGSTETVCGCGWTATAQQRKAEGGGGETAPRQLGLQARVAEDGVEAGGGAARGREGAGEGAGGGPRGGGRVAKAMVLEGRRRQDARTKC